MTTKLPNRGAALLGALADSTRKEIFNLLLEQPLVVKVIAADMPISQSAVSQHLKVMKEAGLVLEEKLGRSHQYSVNPVALDWLAWQFGLLRDGILQLGDKSPATPQESADYDAVDQGMEQWAEQWPELDTMANGLMVRLVLIGRHLDWLLERSAARFDLTIPQVVILSTLDRIFPNECSLKQLAQVSLSQSSATERQLAGIVERGLVGVNPPEQGGRGQLVSITEQGRELLHELMSDQQEVAPIYNMNGDDRVRLARLLRPLLRELRDVMVLDGSRSS